MLGESEGWIEGNPYSWTYRDGKEYVLNYQHCYTNKGDALDTGWKQVNGKWYYFDATSGRMYQGETYTINEKRYTIADNGV